MVTGLVFILLGVMILLHPQILVAMVAGVFILIGLGMVAAGWQFRRLQRRSGSGFMNWLIRF